MSGISSSSLNVTRNTTVKDLQNFLQTSSSQGLSKLEGQVGKDGILRLVAKKELSVNWPLGSRAAMDRRLLAAAAIDQIIGGVRGRLEGKFSDKEALKTVFDGYKSSLTSGVEHSRIRIENTLQFMEKLGKLELASSILKAGSKPTAPEVPTTRQIRDVLPSDKIASLGTMSSIATVGGQTREMPELVLGSKTYVPQRFLAEAGFGQVFRYVNKHDETDIVAVKIASDSGKTGLSPEEARAKFEDEACTHFEIGGKAHRHPNILEMKGAFHFADGNPGVIMDFAPNGSLFELARGMNLLKGPGITQVTPELADVISGSMLGEISDGLSFLHQNGFAHNDSKDGNVMIGKDGHPVLIDFGESKKIVDTHGPELLADNTNYAAPELIFVRDNAQKRDVREEISTSLKFDKDHFDQFEFANDDEKTRYVQDQKARNARLKGEFGRLFDAAAPIFFKDEIDRVAKEKFDAIKSDAWSLGTMAFTLKTGKQVDSFGKVDMQARLKTFEKTLGEMKDGTLDEHALIPRTGDHAMDNLLERQLSKDKDTRMLPKDFKRDPAIRRPGVGHDSVFAFVPVLQKMGKLAIEKDDLQNDIKEIKRNWSKNHAGPLSESEQRRVDGIEDKIRGVESRMSELQVEFHTKKQDVLYVIAAKTT